MDEQLRADSLGSSENASPILQPGVTVLVNNSAEELPTIMATLVLDENAADGSLKDNTSFSTDSVCLRRSQRKQAVPRVLAGGVTKRYSMFARRTIKKDPWDVPILQTDADITEFYANYNKKFTQPKTKSLETIYEEPIKKKRIQYFSKLGRIRLLKTLKSGQPRRSNLQFLGSKNQKEWAEDVKNHFAKSGLVTLAE